MRTSGERLRQEGRQAGRQEGRQEGRLEGQHEGRLETIDAFVRTGVDWSVIERATGIGEEEYGKLKSEPSNGGSTDRDGHGRD